MDSPAPRLSESNLRKLSRGLRSSKKSRLSVHSSLETQSVQDGSLGGRSVSLSTLLPSGGAPGSVPRVDKLQSLEAKMASIEVSLGWRRRREALLETLPRAARDLVRELDTLHQTVREKENCIQGLRTQITNLGGTVVGVSDGMGGVVSESERKTIQERLNKVEAEIEAKKVAVKNLKLTLDKIDITDNIDVRIRAAELEYELEREELNILNLKEEASVLTTRLQESCLTTPLPGGTLTGQQKTRISFQELLAIQGNPSIVAGVSLISASVSHTPGNPPFHVTYRPPFGCVIDWATDDTRLKKGDRIVEINSEIVLGKNIDDVTKFMSSSSHLALVVARPMENPNGNRKLEKQLEEKVKENKELLAKVDKTLKERDSYKNDNTRLSHRISYLEDQVNELQLTLQKAKDAAIITGSPNEVLTPSQPGATIIQVFQKGPQTLAVAGTELEDTENRVQEYPTLPRLKSPSCSSHDSGSNNRIDEKGEEESQRSKVSEGNESIPHRSFEVISPQSPPDQCHSSRQPQVFQNYGPSLRPRRSIDDHNEYQTINIKCKLDTNTDKSHRKNNSDYDCIEKLRDKLTEKSPSYSYKSPNDFVEEQRNTKNENDYQKSKRPPDRDYNPSFSENIYGQLTKLSRKKESEQNHSNSRPSSREDFLSSPTFKNGETRPSRSMNGCERPQRRVVSPGAEDIRPIRPRPIPPKKPERLSLQRTTSMQSVEDTRPCSRASSGSTPSKCQPYRNGYSSSENVFYSGDYTFNNNNIISSSEEKKTSLRDDENKGSISKAGSISEEKYPIPSPRNISQSNSSSSSSSNSSRSSLQNFRESRRLTLSSIDSSPNYGSPLPKHSPHIMNGRQSYSRLKSPDASLHLDATLGLDLHEDVRAQPLYEFLRRTYESSSNSPSSSSSNSNQRSTKHTTPRSQDKEGFEAPPTPSTPPRGINLSMKNSGKKGEEWC